MDTTLSNIEEIELNALINCVYELSGYDFRQYSRTSLYRNIKRELEKERLNYISELIPIVSHHPEKLNNLLQNLSVNVTEFFRDPEIYATLVEQIFPILKSFPFIKIWHAGCSCGKEVYSMAILLEEAGLLDRTLIYATDFNHSILSQAKRGIFHREEIQKFNHRYLQSGGKYELQHYFHRKYNMAKINSEIRQRITFAHHNLATDSVFGEMQLIVCKNVLIYFNKQLKKNTIKLFHDSLYQGGFLCLGTTEPLDYTSQNSMFSPISKTANIYKKNVYETTAPMLTPEM